MTDQLTRKFERTLGDDILERPSVLIQKITNKKIKITTTSDWLLIYNVFTSISFESDEAYGFFSLTRLWNYG